MERKPYFFLFFFLSAIVKKLTSGVESKTIDRVLDVLLIRPFAAQIKEKKKKPQLQTVKRHQRRILSLSPSPSDDNDSTAPFAPPNSTLSPPPQAAAAAVKTKTPFEQLQADLDIPDGLRLPDDELIEIEEWEALTGRRLVETDVDEIAGSVGWGLFKWEDLQYDQGESHTRTHAHPVYERVKTDQQDLPPKKKSMLGYTSTFVITPLRCIQAWSLQVPRRPAHHYPRPDRGPDPRSR